MTLDNHTLIYNSRTMNRYYVDFWPVYNEVSSFEFPDDRRIYYATGLHDATKRYLAETSGDGDIRDGDILIAYMHTEDVCQLTYLGAAVKGQFVIYDPEEQARGSTEYRAFIRYVLVNECFKHPDEEMA